MDAKKKSDGELCLVYYGIAIHADNNLAEKQNHPANTKKIIENFIEKYFCKRCLYN